MVKLNAKNTLLWIYIPVIIFVFLLYLLNRLLVPSPWIINLIFLSLLLLPGFFLKRILKAHFFRDNLGNFLINLALGLVVNLGLSFLAVILGLTITGFLWFYFIVLIILFFGAIVTDYFWPDRAEKIFHFKDIFKVENLIFVFIFFLTTLVLMTVDQLGTNFTGDPMYHIATIRKVVEGSPLTIENLNYVKNQTELAYGIPVWHVFLGLATKITQTNIFTFYREITTVLVLLVFLIWYWLFLKILPTRSVAILALFLFILFHFERNGYLYTRLPVPDTFGMLILMPLCFGLAIKYIFNKESNYKHLIILSLMVTLMGLIHWTQYFYYLFAMGLFGTFYLIFKFKDEDFKIIFRKMLLAIFANVVLVVPVLLFLQAKSQAISQNIQMFSTVTKGSTNDRLYKFDPYFKLSYIMLPLIGIFIRKYRRLIFILAVFLVGPLVYNVPGVYGLCRRVLSHVFVNRLYTNLGQWPYVIWALMLGFILVLIDRILAKIYSSRKYLRYIIDGFLGIFLIWMFWVQYQTEQIEKWHDAVFSNSVFNWLNAHYYWLIPIITFIALLIFIIQKYNRPLLTFFTFEEYKNSSTMLILALMIVFFLGIASFGHLNYYPAKEFQNWHFFSKATDPTLDIVNFDKFGGMEAIDFIKSNIPPKSVFDTNTLANYTLPMLVDVHMASMTFDPEPTKKYKNLYSFNIPIDQKIAMLKEGDIDYLIYEYQTLDMSSPFDPYPQYFTKIFSNDKAVIYQINKSAL